MAFKREYLAEETDEAGEAASLTTTQDGPRLCPIFICSAIGIIAATVAFFTFTAWDLGAGDFTWSWRAARALLAKQNPYHTIQPLGAYPYDAPFYSPLPAALVALPFSPFPLTVAGALFVGVSAAILAWALCRDEPDRLLLFASAPYWMALRWGQWSPLLTATLLIPALAALVVVKPNLGLAVLVYRPRWQVVAAGAIFGIISLLILPSWPLDWFNALATNRHTLPVLTIPGCFVLLALLRWRDPRARLLIGLAIMPQRLLFYDQLALLLVAPTLRTQLALIILGWVGFLGWQSIGGPYTYAAPPWVLWLCYLPALIVVLAPLREQRMSSVSERVW